MVIVVMFATKITLMPIIHDFFLVTLPLKLNGITLKLFDVSMRFNGFPLGKARRLLETIQQQNDADFQKYSLQKRQDIVNYHLKHNPFYKSLTKLSHFEDWKTIPVMTKRDLQAPLKQRLSD